MDSETQAGTVRMTAKQLRHYTTLRAGNPPIRPQVAAREAGLTKEQRDELESFINSEDDLGQTMTLRMQLLQNYARLLIEGLDGIPFCPAAAARVVRLTKEQKEKLESLVDCSD